MYTSKLKSMTAEKYLAWHFGWKMEKMKLLRSYRRQQCFFSFLSKRKIGWPLSSQTPLTLENYLRDQILIVPGGGTFLSSFFKRKIFWEPVWIYDNNTIFILCLLFLSGKTVYKNTTGQSLLCYVFSTFLRAWILY